MPLRGGEDERGRATRRGERKAKNLALLCLLFTCHDNDNSQIVVVGPQVFFSLAHPICFNFFCWTGLNHLRRLGASWPGASRDCSIHEYADSQYLSSSFSSSSSFSFFFSRFCCLFFSLFCFLRFFVASTHDGNPRPHLQSCQDEIKWLPRGLAGSLTIDVKRKSAIPGEPSIA